MNIEEEFFKIFGIEKQQTCSRSDTCYNGSVCNDCEGCNAYKYPQITDRILLELICILNTITEPDLGDINYARLRIAILEQCVKAITEVDWENREPSKEEFIEEVRSLFDEVLR